MSSTPTDSVFRVRVKRIDQLCKDIVLNVESYIRVRFAENSVKKKTNFGMADGKGGYVWSDILEFKVTSDGLTSRSILVELKQRKRFVQSAVLANAEISLKGVHGFNPIHKSGELKDKTGRKIGCIHLDLSFRDNSASSVVSGMSSDGGQSTTHGSIHGSQHGSHHVSIPGSQHGLYHVSIPGSQHGSYQSYNSSSIYGSPYSPVAGSTHAASDGLIRVQTSPNQRKNIAGSDTGFPVHSQVPWDVAGAKAYGQVNASYLPNSMLYIQTTPMPLYRGNSAPTSNLNTLNAPDTHSNTRQQ